MDKTPAQAESDDSGGAMDLVALPIPADAAACDDPGGCPGQPDPPDLADDDYVPL